MHFEPKVGRAAVLELSSGNAGATVVDVDGDRVTLDVDLPADEIGRSLVRVDFPDDAGLVRAQVGSVHAGSTDHRIVVRLEGFERCQRRTHVRARTQVGVMLSLVTEGFTSMTVIRGVTLDLGQGGARIALEEPVPTGKSVAVALDLNGEDVLVVGRVLEVLANQEARVAFGEMSESSREHIVSRVMSATLASPAARRIKRR